MESLSQALLLLLLLASVATSQIIYPDQYDSMLEAYQAQDYRPYVPQSQLNEVEGPPYQAPPPGGLIEVYDPVPQRFPTAYPPAGFRSPVQSEVQRAPVYSAPVYSAPVAYSPRPQNAVQVAPQVYDKASAQGTPFDTILPPKWRDHVINVISKGVMKFTLDMDRAIEKSLTTSNHDNILFSPVSLTLTLAMVLLASGGKTFEEVAKILGLESGVDISNHSEIVHQIFGLLIQQSDRNQLLQNSAPQSKFAFGLFMQDGFPIRDQFRAVSEKVYQSEVMNVDFAHAARQAQKTVNDWVNSKTNGKIKNLLSDPPNPSTELIITSALYFSGEWQQHFEGKTTRKPFNIEPNETVEVDMMFSGGTFPFYEDQNLKILALPYKGEQVSMYVILPNAPGTAALKQLKRSLTPDTMEGLIQKMVNSTCIVGLPRMKLSSTLKLQSALEALGLRSLFDPRTADLSVLSPGRGARLPAPGGTTNRPNLFPSRIGTGTGTGSGSQRESYHRYEDVKGGYMVEQWHNGYNLKWIQGRARRQTRPIAQEFLEFLNSHQLPNYGIDELRNGARIANPGLYADDVIHKVEMTVDERGTEAAAATGTLLDRSGDFKRFVANRPFLFFVRHDPAKVIWFWGTINRPTPFYAH